MRSIDTHHDGFGLNDRIMVTADARDPNAGNASHTYEAIIYDDDIGNPAAIGRHVATIQYQHGPRHEEGSTPGITDEALLAIVLDRYRGFQSGPFACRENAIVITKLEEAMHWMHARARARARAKQNVLGKNEKHDS